MRTASRCSTTAARCPAPTSCGRRASASTTTSPAIRRPSCAAARACSRASRSTCGSPISSVTPACCREPLCRHALARPPASSRSRPTSTATSRRRPGQPAASYELNVTDNDFRFPQVWRSNIAVDRRLPGGITGTAEFIYNRDVNGIYYINANLPAANTAFVGADNRPRWTTTPRINNATGNQVTSAIVHEEPGHRPQLEPRVLGVEADVARPGAAHRLQLRRGEEHHRSGLNGRSRRGTATPLLAIPTTRASAILERVAGPPLLPVGDLHQAVLRVGRDVDLGVLGDAAHSATPATSSRQTPTATAPTAT